MSDSPSPDLRYRRATAAFMRAVRADAALYAIIGAYVLFAAELTWARGRTYLT